MKHYLYLPVLLLTGIFLGGCSEDQINGKEDPVVAAEGARLQVSFRNGTTTRAIGDPFAATAEEKKINKLSFYVYPDKEADKELVPFQRYVFDMTEVTVDNPLEKDSVTIKQLDDGQYTCEFILREGAGFNCCIVALANLPDEFDLTNNLNTYTNLQKTLLDVSTMPCIPSATPKDDGKYGLPMYAEDHRMIRKSMTTDVSFQMQRLAARIDISNRAYNKDEKEKGFVLESARVINAKRQSYVIPATEEPWTAACLTTDYDWVGNTTPGVNDKIVVVAPAAGNGIDEVDATMDAGSIEQRLWHELYVSENDDADEATATTVEIKGLFRNAPFSRIIPFVNKDKTAVTIERNHRYLILINPAPDQTDVTFNIQVTDWDAVDTVHVKPTQKIAPEISDVVCTGTDCSYDDTDKKTVSASATGTDAAFTFTAVCPFDSDTKVVYPEDYTGNEWVGVIRGNSVETKASTGIKRSYTVNLTGQDDPTTAVERSALLLIRNVANATARDTIYIRQTITTTP